MIRKYRKEEIVFGGRHGNLDKLIQLHYKDRKMVLSLSSGEDIHVITSLLKVVPFEGHPFYFFRKDVETFAPEEADSFYLGELEKIDLGLGSHQKFRQRVKYLKILNWWEIMGEIEKINHSNSVIGNYWEKFENNEFR